MNNWIYKDKEITSIEDTPSGAVGFVYVIEVNGLKYIGQKHLHFKRKNHKGKRVTKESDWKSYTSSSETIKELCKKYPNDMKREILYFCPSKSALSYLETKEQIDRGALMTEEYANGILNIRIPKTGILNKVLIL